MKAILMGVLLAASMAHAAPAGQLANLARQAQSSFQPVSEADVLAARAALMSARDNLDRFLARDPRRAADWRTYLQLALLDEELARGVDADIAVLDREVLARARANREGLDLLPFRRYRAAIDEFLRTLRAYREAPAQEEYEPRLEALTALLDAYETQPTAAAYTEIAQHLAWLHARRQAPQLVRSVGQRLAAPNAVFSVSAHLISTWSVEEVDRNTDIFDVEDKQVSVGVGRLRGRAAAFPVPGEDGIGRLEMRFRGTLQTRVATHQDPVRILSHGVAPVIARKPVTITEHGLVGYPTCSRVCYNNFVDCIGTRLKLSPADALVRKLASVYIHRNEDEIERDASRDAAERFNQEFDEDVQKELDEANRGLTEKFRQPLLRQDLYPQQFEFRTTFDHLEAILRYAHPGGPAAPGAPPELAAGWDLAVRLHESYLNNTAYTLLAGRLYSIEEMESLLQDAMGDFGLKQDGSSKSSEESAAKEEAIPPGDVGIEFDDAAPLQVQFADGIATITVRGKRYVYEDRAYPPMNIVIRYRLENDRGSLRATLVGEPEYVAPPGVGGLRVITLRRILRSHINPRLEQEIVQGEVHLPDSDGEDEIGALDFHQVAADDGWLTVSLRRRNRTVNALGQ